VRRSPLHVGCPDQLPYNQGTRTPTKVHSNVELCALCHASQISGGALSPLRKRDSPKATATVTPPPGRPMGEFTENPNFSGTPLKARGAECPPLVGATLSCYVWE
jgi:hypothetical protein